MIDIPGASGAVAETLPRLSREFEAVSHRSPFLQYSIRAVQDDGGSGFAPEFEPACARWDPHSFVWLPRSLKLNGTSNVPNILTPRSVICEDDVLRFL